MKELKEYLHTIVYASAAGVLWLIFVALLTGFAASTWWIMRHIWCWINP